MTDQTSVDLGQVAYEAAGSPNGSWRGLSAELVSFWHTIAEAVMAHDQPGYPDPVALKKFVEEHPQGAPQWTDAAALDHLAGMVLGDRGSNLYYIVEQATMAVLQTGRDISIVTGD